MSEVQSNNVFLAIRRNEIPELVIEMPPPGAESIVMNLGEALRLICTAKSSEPAQKKSLSLEYHRTYYAKNRENYCASRRKSYQKHKDSQNQKRRDLYQKHKQEGRTQEYYQKYYLEHLEEKKEYQKKRYEKLKEEGTLPEKNEERQEEMREKQRIYYQENKERIKEKNLRRYYERKKLQAAP